MVKHTLGQHPPHRRLTTGRRRSAEEVFGATFERRPLTVRYFGDPRARLRIFVLAGQHGDEADTRMAAAELVRRCSAGCFPKAVHLALVADANPDGAFKGTRRNAAEIDLNRDHLHLSAPETLAVHGLVEWWRPHLILDVHTYRPWRKELLFHDFVFPQEIMIDFPTNLAVHTSMGAGLQKTALAHVTNRLRKAGIRANRYTRVLSGIVRHSNVDILDARNALALRFEIPTLLIEGRRASPGDAASFVHTPLALLSAIEAAVDWAAGNAALLKRRPPRTWSVPVRCTYLPSGKPHFMEMQLASTGAITRVQIPGSYLPTVKATKAVKVPRAYAVPKHLRTVLEILARHGFKSARSASCRAQMYHIESVEPGVDGPVHPICSVHSIDFNSDDFVFFPARQCGSCLLALILEPESQFGPPRIDELANALQPGSVYPILRLT